MRALLYAIFLYSSLSLLLAVQARAAEDAAKPKPRALPSSNRLCLVCHLDLREELIARAHEEADIVCAACHGVSMDHMHDEMLMTKPDNLLGRKEVEPLCGGCHEKHEDPAAVEAFRKKWYGRDRPNGRVINEHSVCTDCHGVHNIVKEMGGAGRKTIAGENWKPLFDGTTLTSWKTAGAGQWNVKRGRIVGAAGAGAKAALARDFALRAFRFAITYRLSGDVTASVRWSGDPKDLPQGASAGWCVRLTGAAANPKGGAGSLEVGDVLVCRNPCRDVFDPEGWNTVTLTREKGFVRVWLNGIELYRVHVAAVRPERLTVELEGREGAALEVREITVSEIPTEEQD